jgi:hypothetical protein
MNTFRDVDFAKDDAEIVRDILRGVLHEALYRIRTMEPWMYDIARSDETYETAKVQAVTIIEGLIKLHC